MNPAHPTNQRIPVPTHQHLGIKMNNNNVPYSIIQFQLYEDYLDSKLTEMDLVHLKVSNRSDCACACAPAVIFKVLLFEIGIIAIINVAVLMKFAIVYLINA